jgi:soluble lytic murein transglycosylase-like protein
LRKLLALLTLALCAACPSYNGFSDDFSAPGLFKLLEPSSAAASSAANVVLAGLFMPRLSLIEDTPALADEVAREPVSVEQICRALTQAATDHGIPAGFLARLIWQESRFDPQARSPVGALGVAQFMPRTAAAFGLDDPHDPLTSVAASARFLRQLRDQFGNLGLAAAAYNAGSGRVSKWLKGENELPNETENYVRIITGSTAKRWTSEEAIELHIALPRQAPCEGIEGLSRLNAHARLPVALSISATSLLAQADAARRSRLAAQRAAKSRKALMARASKGINRKIRDA